MSENKTLIFISYSHHDRQVCESIASMLERPSRVIWYDKGLVPGEVFRKKIVEKIRAADYFIVMLSCESIRSEWVLDEVEYAKKQHKRILPVYIDNTSLPDDLDMILQRYHSLFWHLRSSDKQFEESLDRIFGDQEEEPGSPQVPEGQNCIDYSSAETEQMRRLLAQEERGVFSQCYSPKGACLLGKAYMHGCGCAEDRKKAAHYFRIAQFRGSADASAYLLQMRLEDQEEATWDEPDEEFCAPIIQELRRLADAGSEAAMMIYARILWYGRYGCPKDPEESARLYVICAENGNARAQHIMSSNYYLGDGVEKDYDLAIMYANLALEQGYIKSWRCWGQFCRDGLLVPRDYARAMEYYEIGAKKGDCNCYNQLGDMFYYGWGCEPDYSKAFAYYLKGEQAPEKEQKYGLREAKHALGRCYESGHGTAYDLEKAVEKYLESYHLGSRKCKQDYLRCAGLLMQQRNSPD